MININSFLTYIQEDKEISLAVNGIKTLEVMRTDSSHSLFYIIYSRSNKRYICKIVIDTTLSGTTNCALYEYRGLLIASSLNLAPKPVYFNQDKKLIIVEYVDHVQYDTISLESLKLRANMAGKLAFSDFEPKHFLQTHTNFSEDFYSHRRLLYQALFLDPGLKDWCEELDSLMDQSYEICSKFDKKLLHMPEILSHNDLVGDNLLKGFDGNYYLIDFETIGLSKPDFPIGQLAVDAEIDWYVHNKQRIPLNELIKMLQESSSIPNYGDIFNARVVERLVQNAAYGLRQVANREKMNFAKEYIDLKKLVINYCIKRLQEILSKGDKWCGR